MVAEVIKMTITVNQESRVNTIMSKVVVDMKELYGKNLRKVILYGSYARGEQDEYSDMDIMVLVDIDREELCQYRGKVFDKTYEIGFEHNVLLPVISENYQHFYKWVPYLPFYSNVEKDGIEFYAN
jgi:predicted nucleotidyltransferase